MLPNCQATRWAASAGEQEPPWLATPLAQICVKRLPCLCCQLEAHRSPRFLLADHCPTHTVAVRRYVIDADGNDDATAQLAVNREVKEREVIGHVQPSATSCE